MPKHLLDEFKFKFLGGSSKGISGMIVIQFKFNAVWNGTSNLCKLETLLYEPMLKRKDMCLKVLSNKLHNKFPTDLQEFLTYHRKTIWNLFKWEIFTITRCITDEIEYSDYRFILLPFE